MCKMTTAEVEVLLRLLVEWVGIGVAYAKAARNKRPAAIALQDSSEPEPDESINSVANRC
jgi:hypothetical protein